MNRPHDDSSFETLGRVFIGCVAVGAFGLSIAVVAAFLVLPS